MVLCFEEFQFRLQLIIGELFQLNFAGDKSAEKGAAPDDPVIDQRGTVKGIVLMSATSYIAAHRPSPQPSW